MSTPSRKLRLETAGASSAPVVAAIAVLLGGVISLHADWPQFLGPARNGTCSAAAIAKSWPKEGPKRLWVKDVGEGFSGPVIAGSRVILNHRLAGKDRVECFDWATGKSLWIQDVPARYVDDFGFDQGPRATPSIEGDHVVTLGADGLVRCLSLSEGAVLWSVDGKAVYSSRKGFFGLAPSPLIHKGMVFLNIGGTDGASVVALDLTSGGLRWKAGDDEASYASPVLAERPEGTQLLVLTRDALMGFDPSTGRLIFRYPWRPTTHASVSAATPLVVGDTVFLSASYDTSSTLLRFGAGDPKPVWSGPEILASHYTTPVAHGGHLYGLDGRQERGCELRCVDLDSGKVAWTIPGWPAGSLLIAGEELLILSEKGELIRGKASPEKFIETGRAQLLPFLARAHPALSEGRFYARSKDKLFCFDLR